MTGEQTVIDLRSDTVTRPTAAMREAMARAVVGDDVLGDDPTVKQLEARAADMLGKEAALFFPSGTMANLAALMAHTEPGEEVLVGEASHIYYYEVGGVSRVAGLLPRLFVDGDTEPTPAALEALLRAPDVHFPKTGLLCLENTHNRGGGTVLTPAKTEALARVARAAGFPVHLDGARVFNGAAALNVDVKALVEPVDSVMFALSKCLSAPVGSVLAGDEQFIARARRRRKLLGGGMRQAGVIAAAGLVALETMVHRLRDDNDVAAELAAALARIDGIGLDAAAVQTNIVIFAVPEDTDAPTMARRLAEHNVRASVMDARHVRFVTHRHIDADAIPAIVAAVRASL